MYLNKSLVKCHDRKLFIKDLMRHEIKNKFMKKKNLTVLYPIN